MIFSSNIFVFLFLPAAVLGYQLLSRLGNAFTLGWLLLASLFFYGYWKPSYLVLLLLSAALNYGAGLLIERSAARARAQGAWLTAAVVCNLLVLGYYKYLFPSLGFLHEHHLFSREFGRILLPLGISFFTFTQIAFLVDLKQGIAKVPDFGTYALFVTFFPHLIAGPVLHPREIIPQFLNRRTKHSIDREDLVVGVTWFVLGLSKKVLIADRIAPVVDGVFGHPGEFTTGGVWIGALAYTVQLYFDFSGYSDMAVGIARMFSIRFPLNFNSPFKAASVAEYWDRWHISMSRWFADYVYSPISIALRERRRAAGKSVMRTAYKTPAGFLTLIAIPTITTMFLAGVWHGAGLQFLAWGTIYGVYLVIYHAWRTFLPVNSRLAKLPMPVCIGVTYFCVVIAQVFFRANSISDAGTLLRAMAGAGSGRMAFSGSPYLIAAGHLGSSRGAVVALLFCYVLIWLCPNTQEILGQVPRDEDTRLPPRVFRWRPSMAWAACIALLLTVSVLMMDTSAAFLYFQF